MKYFLSMLIISIFLVAGCGEKKEVKENANTEAVDKSDQDVAKDIENMDKAGAEQETVDVAVDQSDPKKVVQAVFDAAQTKNYALLQNLCAPDCDSDCKMICQLSAENEDEFLKYFSKGKITGEAKINGDKADVPFLFGPQGDKEETMRLVKVDGKWFLQSY